MSRVNNNKVVNSAKEKKGGKGKGAALMTRI